MSMRRMLNYAFQISFHKEVNRTEIPTSISTPGLNNKSLQIAYTLQVVLSFLIDIFACLLQTFFDQKGPK